MITESKLFTVLDGAKPLARCVAWARHHCVQANADAEDEQSAELVTPMYVICVLEMLAKRNGGGHYVTRKYLSATRSALWGVVASVRSDTARHLDEVITDGPCKFYLDLEVACTEREQHERAREAATRLIAKVRQFHAERGQRDVDPVCLEAHKESKFSMHVVFDRSLWQSTEHCREYVRRLRDEAKAEGDQLTHDLIDPQVYSANHTMRTYRSSKPEEPQRSFVVDGERQLDLQRPPQRAVFERSLVTHIVLHSNDDSEAEPVVVSSLFLAKYPEVLNEAREKPIVLRSRATLLRSLNGSGSFGANESEESDDSDDVRGSRARRGNTPNIGEFGAMWRALQELFRSRQPSYPSLVHNMPGRLVIQCNSRQCVIWGAQHDVNTIKIQVDMLRAVWRPSCHNKECKAQPREWRKLPLDAETAVQRFVDAYYRHAWRGAQRCTELAALFQ